MQITPEMEAFKLKLEDAYNEARSKIPKDSSDEFLLTSPEYKRCVLIYHVLAVLNSKDGYEWGEVAVEIDDYDLEKFLTRFSVDIISGEKGYKIDFKLAEESDESSDKLQDAQ